MASTGFREIADHLHGLLVSGNLGADGTPLPPEAGRAPGQQAVRQAILPALALLEADGPAHVAPGGVCFAGPGCRPSL